MLSLLARLNWPFLVLWAGVALFGVCVDRYRRSLKFGKLRGCQTSHKQALVKDPFIGLDFIHERVIRGLSGRRLLDCIEKFKQYGSTYSVDRLTYQVVQTCDPKNLKQVLATGFDDFQLPSSRVSVMGELLGSGIFTLDGDLWSHARSILRPSLMKHKMDGLPSIIEHHVQQFLTHLPRQGEDVDLQPLFFELTMDIATEFLMGYSSNMLDPSRKREKEQQFFDDYMLCSEEAIKKMSYGPLRFFRLNLAATKAKKRVFKYMDEYIEECFERQDGTFQRTDEHNAFQEIASAVTDRQSLRDQLLHFLLASRDTTASLLSNLFFVLAKNPETYARLRSEVLSKVAYENPTFSDLRDIEYLRWCVNECKSLIHDVIFWYEALITVQPFDYILLSPRTAGKPSVTRPSPAVAALTANHPFSFVRAPWSCTMSSPCTVTPPYSATGWRNSFPSDGAGFAQAGVSSPSVAAPEFALAVSGRSREERCPRHHANPG